MNKYEEISPRAAKWMLPDETITDAMPIAIVSRDGAIFLNDTVPDDSVGKLGDFCITQDGIYMKRMVQSGGGFNLVCDNAAFNGYWRDMGVNDVISGNGGDPQGTHYYQHQSGLYFLCWNTAYGGYWWINNQLSYDNGSANAYRNTPVFTQIPPNDGWSGAIPYGTMVEWTAVPNSEPHPGWERCFDFREKDSLPYFKSSRLMKYSESIVKLQNNSGISLYTYPDMASGGLMLNAYLNLGGSGNMARFDNNALYVGEAYYINHSPTGATQALSIASYRNFKVNLSAAAITLSFSGSVPTGNYPCTLKVWLIPKSTVSGTPKHTVKWPASITWIGEEAHEKIGKTGQPDTPVLVELTTFDNGSKWVGRAFNALYPEKEA